MTLKSGDKVRILGPKIDIEKEASEGFGAFDVEDYYYLKAIEGKCGEVVERLDEFICAVEVDGKVKVLYVHELTKEDK